MTRSGPQGPGWWQASDGNWYPPESRAGYPPPPPPAPAPYGQNPGYPAYTGPAPAYGPPTANRQPTQTALPVRLIYSGISLGLVMNIRNIGAHPGDLSAAGVVATMLIIGVIYGVCALLAYRAAKQLPAQVGALIGLTVVMGIIVILDIVGLAMPDDPTGSPLGYVADLADVVTVTGIFMLWYGRSNTSPQQY